MKETSDNMLHFTVRTFLTILGGLIIGTNVANTIFSNIMDNKEDIEYNKKAEERRRTHLEDKINYKITISDLKEDIEILEEKLENCKDGKR
jgi:hypothetical protein